MMHLALTGYSLDENTAGQTIIHLEYQLSGGLAGRCSTVEAMAVRTCRGRVSVHWPSPQSESTSPIDPRTYIADATYVLGPQDQQVFSAISLDAQRLLSGLEGAA